jgi:hypothetical protein
MDDLTPSSLWRFDLFPPGRHSPQCCAIASVLARCEGGLRTGLFPRLALGKFAVALSALLLAPLVFAHATLVLGTLASDPATPRPDEPFMLSLELVDPTQVPVEDAWVLSEFRPQGAPEGTEPIEVRFEESQTAGLYQAQVTLPERGNYALLLRDQTYRQEEAQATLTFPVGRTSAEPLRFVFPPTATGPQGLTTWLLWLIGLPLLAALIVTVLVLSRPQRNVPAQNQPSAQGDRKTVEGQAELQEERA